MRETSMYLSWLKTVKKLTFCYLNALICTLIPKMRHSVLKKKHFLLNTASLVCPCKLFPSPLFSLCPPNSHRLCHKEYSVAAWNKTFYHFIWSALSCFYRNGCQGQVKIIATLWLRKKKFHLVLTLLDVPITDCHMHSGK